MKKSRKKFLCAIFGFMVLSGLLPFIDTGNAGSTHVTFHVNAYVAEGYFATDVTSSGDTVKPGEITTITFETKQAKGSLYVDLGSYGGSSISFNTPLSSISIPISGIAGVASVEVDLRGSLEGDLSVNGPGSLSTEHLSWRSWGKKTVTLKAANAKEGDTITITLNLKYTGHIGAHGDTVFGDVTLISMQSLPGVSGSKSVVHTMNVKKEILPGIPGFEILLVLSAILVAVILKNRIRKRNN